VQKQARLAALTPHSARAELTGGCELRVDLTAGKLHLDLTGRG